MTEKTFQLGTAPAVSIDTVNGFIEVEGHRGGTVELLVRRHLRADSEEKAEKARAEERLDISRDGNALELIVKGPYRNGNHRGKLGYESRFDFTLRVPTGSSLDLKTVNHAHIKVRNTTGDFQLNVINGGIEMDGVTGSGRAHALNGNVEAAFDSSLSADFRVKTFNGEVLSDFPITRLPARASTEHSRGRRRVHKADDFSSLRIGAGGPVIELDAFNGDIRILRSK
ncbi:MAG: hypothetical protein GY953_56885 [bacterium]|nr:hypothetical protein [bacterium]